VRVDPRGAPSFTHRVASVSHRVEALSDHAAIDAARVTLSSFAGPSSSWTPSISVTGQAVDWRMPAPMIDLAARKLTE
jgi:hypothetical protein